MRCTNLVVIYAALLLGFGGVETKAQSTEEILGAIAGGALGSTIGDGDGRKAATVIGAVLGYRMGEKILNKEHYAEFMSYNESDFYNYCRQRVPREYRHRYNLRDMWIRGCTQRLEHEQYELEQRAYEDGYNGSSN